MQSTYAYLPIDRRRGSALPAFDRGVVLFADISGFTHLTQTLTDRLGPRRGAEAATHHLNTVYGSLVHTVHGRGGSVVSFSGDGMLYWFAGGDAMAAAARQAVAAAARGARTTDPRYAGHRWAGPGDATLSDYRSCRRDGSRLRVYAARCADD